ncbi:SAM-dependent methyltransferase [Amycolatopsis rubida]|uniref:S-adenosyl methyltransferase n=1 Tax=Amycolatopsis rubida TaxID=112413 RepID=A0A1I6BMA1_9PSEU|nr:SAM-dependent methyltransferase [Amycolatopsis rubida]SFQ81957.1 S-adenosyl methyltransferase [Amycolatopsis rubida]
MAGEDREPDDYPPPGIDLERPSVARVYDYYLDGDASWTVDRDFGDAVLGEFPELRQIAKANRVFLHRVVRHLVGKGVTQFVDIGSGLPTMRHAHEVADEVRPGETRVVYADYDPIAVAHSQDLLEQRGDPRRHAAIHADLRSPDRLWEQAAKTGVLDLDKPTAILLIAVLHVQQPASARSGGTGDVGPAAVARYRELAASGSYLAISHVTDEGVPAAYRDRLARLKRMYDERSSPVVWRTQREIQEFFGDFDLIPPGLTWTPQWHPEEQRPGEPDIGFGDPSESVIVAGVAKKR